MGGLDLLPPAKGAGRPRRSRSSTSTMLVIVIGISLIACLIYATTPLSAALPVDRGQQEPASEPPHSSVLTLSEHPPPRPSSLPPPSPPPPPPSPEDVVALKLQAGGKQVTLRLRLLPQHSESSVAFMRHAATHSCAGELNRSEKDFLVQGRIACPGGTAGVPKVVKGSCPPGVQVDRSRACPSHDPQCGCHGPIMGKGMVGWAGGSAGPDLFIYTAAMDMARCPVGGCQATHWSRDHTVFAEVADEATWAAIAELYKLPVRRSGMTFFADKLAMLVGW